MRSSFVETYHMYLYYFSQEARQKLEQLLVEKLYVKSQEL